MKHLLNSFDFNTLVTILCLMVGFAVQWGVLSTKVEATEASISDVTSVKQDIAVLKTMMFNLNEQNKEMRHDIRQLLRRNP